jgi:hypothetical protein
LNEYKETSPSQAAEPHRHLSAMIEFLTVNQTRRGSHSWSL